MPHPDRQTERRLKQKLRRAAIRIMEVIKMRDDWRFVARMRIGDIHDTYLKRIMQEMKRFTRDDVVFCLKILGEDPRYAQARQEKITLWHVISDTRKDYLVGFMVASELWRLLRTSTTLSR
jgi:hypothetical protein